VSSGGEDSSEATTGAGNGAATVPAVRAVITWVLLSFTGRWLVEPDPDETRAGDDAGAFWGVALTQRGRIAVYVAHVNHGWPASLNDYPSLDTAANDDVPEVIIARAAAELGETRVILRRHLTFGSPSALLAAVGGALGAPGASRPGERLCANPGTTPVGRATPE
jgi:hypothetical protein